MRLTPEHLLLALMTTPSACSACLRVQTSPPCDHVQRQQWSIVGLTCNLMVMKLDQEEELACWTACSDNRACVASSQARPLVSARPAAAAPRVRPAAATVRLRAAVTSDDRVSDAAVPGATVGAGFHAIAGPTAAAIGQPNLRARAMGKPAAARRSVHRLLTRCYPRRSFVPLCGSPAGVTSGRAARVCVCRVHRNALRLGSRGGPQQRNRQLRCWRRGGRIVGSYGQVKGRVLAGLLPRRVQVDGRDVQTVASVRHRRQRVQRSRGVWRCG